MIALKALFIPDQGADIALNAMLAFVPPEKRKRLRGFAMPSDAMRALGGELMARSWLMRRTGLRNQKIAFRIGAHGKPEPALPDTLHFNISHSGAWVAAAFSDVCPVGVDVQRIRPVSKKLAPRFFSPDENAAIEALPPDEQTNLFFKFWTLKEGYLKALGTGFSKPLNSFSIKISGRLIELFEGSEKLPGFAFKTYALDAAHTLAICAEDKRLPAKPDICAWSDLEQMFDPNRDSFPDV